MLRWACWWRGVGRAGCGPAAFAAPAAGAVLPAAVGLKALRAPGRGSAATGVGAAGAGGSRRRRQACRRRARRLLRSIRLEFPTQGNVSVIEPQTYLYYIQTKPSRPSDGVWVPYDDAAEKTVLEDFKRLWATNFLDNLWIEVRDVPYANGVIGKEVLFNMEERQRVKIVDYTGSKKLEQSKIEEKLREESVTIRLDSFIDPALIRRVEGIVRDMFAEKGYEFAAVTHTITRGGRRPEAGQPDVQHRRGAAGQDPQDRLHRQQGGFGRQARRPDEEQQAEWMWSWITGRGTYQAAKFEEDADEGRRVLPERRLRDGPGRPARAAATSRTRRTAGRATSSCASRSPRASATGSATSPSTATRSSRPKACGRSSR